MSGGAGGAAMGGGGNYQARVAGWLAVFALAEEEAQPPLALTAPIQRIACEVVDPVDDVVVTTTTGHIASLQAKRTVSLNRKRLTPDGALTPFASAVEQFVRQYDAAIERAQTGAAGLDPTHDRFVLAVGASSPATVRLDLRGAL